MEEANITNITNDQQTSSLLNVDSLIMEIGVQHVNKMNDTKQIELLNRNISSITQNKHTIEQDIKQKTLSNKQYIDNNNKLSNTITNLNKDIKNSRDEINTKNKNIESFKNEINTKNKNIESFKNEINTKNKNIETLNKSIETLKNEKNIEIETLNKSIDLFKNEINILKLKLKPIKRVKTETKKPIKKDRVKKPK